MLAYVIDPGNFDTLMARLLETRKHVRPLNIFFPNELLCRIWLSLSAKGYEHRCGDLPEKLGLSRPECHTDRLDFRPYTISNQ